MYVQLPSQRMSLPPPPAGYLESNQPSRPATQRVRLRASVGIMSIVLLLLAFVAPTGLRVVLVSAGLLGVMGLRLAAAGAGVARRGAAWTKGHRQQPIEPEGARATQALRGLHFISRAVEPAKQAQRARQSSIG